MKELYVSYYYVNDKIRWRADNDSNGTSTENGFIKWLTLMSQKYNVTLENIDEQG